MYTNYIRFSNPKANISISLLSPCVYLHRIKSQALSVSLSSCLAVNSLGALLQTRPYQRDAPSSQETEYSEVRKGLLVNKWLPVGVAYFPSRIH
jgi:hypothetical protein